jgi:hypothetical protein
VGSRLTEDPFSDTPPPQPQPQTIALFMRHWAAALVVGGVLASVGIVMLTVGTKRFKLVHPTPERTFETIQENVAWAKQHTK